MDTKKTGSLEKKGKSFYTLRKNPGEKGGGPFGLVRDTRTTKKRKKCPFKNGKYGERLGCLTKK